ncbi:MAG TPA: diacylglyceryl transferase, partial [Flavobacteriales bacterium]|nr:diacylglyceryl transferase [Flavobacteriales bacterium]
MANEGVGWMDRLAKRWGVSPSRVTIILVVFACTGFTVVYLKRPLIDLVAGDGEKPLWFSILYYVLILPVYNVLLLVYGAILGQFRFFWEFEKRFLRRITG